MLEILFLGTGASVPSRDRSTSCIAVRGGSDIILMDCGEGSQRQIMISPFSFMKIRAVLITHMHGDHVFGLPGLLQTMSLNGRKEPLTVYGPEGLRAGLDAMMSVTEGETCYDLSVVELSGGERFSVNNMTIQSYVTDHGIRSLGYVLREADYPGKLDKAKAMSLGISPGPEMARLKNGETIRGVRPEDVISPSIPGLSVSYTGDSRPCQGITEASKGVDVLIHESTFMSSESALAHDHFHSTATQAAEAARACGVRALMLTHISNRYDDRGAVVDDVRSIFAETVAVDDLQLYEVTTKTIRLVEP